MTKSFDGDEPSRGLWRRILDGVRRQLASRALYETWFQRVSFGCLAGDELVVHVPNRFFQDWHAAKFRDEWGHAAAEAAGRRIAVRFEVPAGAAKGGDSSLPSATGPVEEGGAVRETPESPRGTGSSGAVLESPPPAPPSRPDTVRPRRDAREDEPPARTPAPLPPTPPAPDALAALRTPQLQPHYTFENFVVGPSNQVAHAAARAVADKPGGTYNPLFLYGSVGLGKTHLLQAICHAILKRSPSFRIVYLTCEQFTNEYVSAIQRNATEGFRSRIRTVDMLAIDDIHFLAGKQRTQEEFFHSFNMLHQANKQVILSSDGPPTDIPTLEERLVSRFKWGLVEELEQPETETRMAIIRRKAELMQLTLPSEVVEYIAQNVRANIREIEGAIANVRSRSLLLGNPIDLSMAKAALEPALRHESTAITLDRITQVVAGHWSAKVSDLRSKKRTKSVSLPRQVIMYLGRELTNLSLEEIGDHFGGRDHTTVLYAIERVAERAEKDEAFRAVLERLKDRLHTR